MTGSGWRVGVLTLAALVAFVACTKRPPSADDAGASAAGPGDAGPEAAAPSGPGAVFAGATGLGGPCKSVYSDCPKVPEGCRATCANLRSTDSSALQGYCTLREVTAEEGKPCVGHWLPHAGGSDNVPTATKLDRVFVCDVSAGLFCEGKDIFDKNPRCKRANALGAKCSFSPYSCGVDADCEFESQTCKPRPGAGGSCAKTSCRGGYECDDKHICRKQKALGEACKRGECLNALTCEGSKCVARPPEAKCPL